MRVCYLCKSSKPDDELSWKSPEHEDSGLCLRCAAIAKLKEEMENQTEYPGKAMKGFPHIKINEGEMIVCPYCGYIEEDRPEDAALYGEQDDYDYMCQECEEEFLLQVRVTFQYTSRKEVSFADAEKRYEKGKTD